MTREEAIKRVDADLREAATWPRWDELKEKVLEVIKTCHVPSLRAAYEIAASEGTIDAITRSTDASYMWTTTGVSSTGHTFTISDTGLTTARAYTIEEKALTPMAEVKEKPVIAPTPSAWPTLVDPDGHRWQTIESTLGEEAFEGSMGTLLVTNREGPYHEARRMMRMAEIRYPMRQTPQERKELGLNGFALELAKRILRTEALRKKKLPILSSTNKTCVDYIKRLVPVIQASLKVKEKKAQELASLLTDRPSSNSNAASLKGLAAAWFLDRPSDDSEDGESESAQGSKPSDQHDQKTLANMLKQLGDMEDVTMSAQNWFSLVSHEAEMRTFKLLDFKLQQAIPGYQLGLDWVIPDIIRATMTATRIAFARAVRPSDTGAIPRYMHRLMIDGMVFGHKRRMTGASVLIDCSGSMGVTQQQVLAIAKHFPAGIVAGYSGAALRILAEKGRVVAQAPPHWQGSNECDGPALEWLLRQSAPRFWISDGGVTLRGDTASSKASNHCEALRRWGQITRIGSMTDALKRLAKVAAGQEA